MKKSLFLIGAAVVLGTTALAQAAEPLAASGIAARSSATARGTATDPAAASNPIAAVGSVSGNSPTQPIDAGKAALAGMLLLLLLQRRYDTHLLTR